jgi:hypothetical protein
MCIIHLLSLSQLRLGLERGAVLPRSLQFVRGLHPRLGVVGGLRGQAAEDRDSLRSTQMHAYRLRMFPELHADTGAAEEDPYVRLHELRHENGRSPEVCPDRLQLPKPAAGVHDDRGVPVLAPEFQERRGVGVPRDEDVDLPVLVDRDPSQVSASWLPGK